MKPLLTILAALTLPIFAASPLKLTLPTDNQALFEGKPEEFYMYVDRTFNNETSKPWTAGQYGFVRTLINTESEGPIATKFHEGIDIKPVKRDRQNNPLDEVRSIASGDVVYVNKNRSGSNYGIYIVIEHNWGHGPFFSLYAHLANTKVEVGQRVLGGTPIGIMGFTGAGITRTRAHLHLELCLLNSLHFNEWLGAKSVHGIYDGRNLTGIDIASLFLATRANPDLSLPEFLSSANPYFKVAIPRKGPLESTTRYPWLKVGNHEESSPSWEISFTDSGIPLSVAPSFREVSKPTITFVRTTRSRHEYYTSSRLQGTGRKATLSPSGLRFIQLVTYEANHSSNEPSKNDQTNDSDESTDS